MKFTSCAPKEQLPTNDYSSSELAAWLRFIDTSQVAVGRYQLDGSENSLTIPALLTAAAVLRSLANRLLARSLILRIARQLGSAAQVGDAHIGPPGQSSLTRSAQVMDGASRPVDFRVRAVLDHVAMGPLQHRQLLVDIAGNLRVSSSYLSRLVVKQTGVPFSRHLQVARMNESARLLDESELSVKEIASATGYEHVPSFDRQFRQYFHVTPSQFRHHARGVLSRVPLKFGGVVNTVFLSVLLSPTIS